MISFGAKVLEIREKMGFASALSFYKWLEEKSDLDFNYAYFKKIENNEKFPSTKVVHGLAANLAKTDRDALILCFCQNQFPKDKHLFENESDAPVHQKEIAKTKLKKSAGTLIGQKELTEKQVSVLASQAENFFLFSLMTLARTKLSKKKLLSYFSEQQLEEAIDQLKKVKLVVEEEDVLSSSYPEFLFPRAHGASLKKMYQQLDIYEREKINFFKFKKHSKAVFLRRISPRYLDLIQGHIDLLYQTLRMSDDQSVDQNETVCSLELQFHSANLPG